MGIALSMLVVYVPPFNIAFGTDYHTTPLVWLIAIGFGVIVVLYSIMRTLILRKCKKIINSDNPIKFSDTIPGLDLAPTKWSTGR